MSINYQGCLRKMTSHAPEEGGKVSYTLNLDGEAQLPLNDFVGKEIELTFLNRIFCVDCGKKVRKTYGDGYCYPCFSTQPYTDMCIMKPETCHYHLGTCRDPQWGLENCFIPHTLYLSRSSNIKIGITRNHQRLTRWIDQGAVEAMKIGEFPSRREVGLAEVAIASTMKDKTNWRKMLTNDICSDPFEVFLDRAKEQLNEEQLSHFTESPEIINLEYPHLKWPEKVKSVKFDKHPQIKGQLIAIKGQYLIFEGGTVTNLRNQSGYEIEFSG